MEDVVGFRFLSENFGGQVRNSSSIEVKWRAEVQVKRGDGMNISLEKLLAKMEDELKGARNAATDAKMREKIHSLKTLCELVLDEPNRERSAAVRTEAPAAVVQNMQIPVVQAQPQPQYQSVPNQQKRLEMDNEANGESLFDF
jgi:hypothetical protein